MVKPLPEWFFRAKSMKVYERIVVETDAPKQHTILANLRKIEGAKFKTRWIKTQAHPGLSLMTLEEAARE